MTKLELVAAVSEREKQVMFRDKDGRDNKIGFYRGPESDRFMVMTLVYASSIYWTQSDMDHEYIMSVVDEFIYQ